MIHTLVIAVPVLLYILIPMSKHARYVLAVLVVGGLYLLFWPTTHKNYRLEKEGMHTVGTLLSKKCEIKNSQTISYKFQAGGKEYMGARRPGVGNQSCENFKVGDQVFITYVTSDPSINTPDREVSSGVFLGVLFSIAMVVCLAWINAEQTRFWNEKLSKRAKNA
jgi:hypothetical protein